MPPQRYGSVIKVKPEKLAEYKALHADPWPQVLATITACNIQKYTIYYRQIGDEHYLFSHYEYWGDDYEADMKKMAADPVTQEWWEVTGPCQEPIPNHNEGEWWAHMEEVFHHD